MRHIFFGLKTWVGSCIFFIRPIRIKWYIIGLSALAFHSLSFAKMDSEVIIGKTDSVVYSQTQIIEGSVSNPSTSNSGTLFVNEKGYPFDIHSPDGNFNLEIILEDSISAIYAQVEAEGETAISDTVRLILGYPLKPGLEIIPEVDGRQITLRAEVIENPLNESIEFIWEEDAENHFSVNVTGKNENMIRFTLPPDAENGEYYYNVTGFTESGRKGFARTFVKVDSTGIIPFDINHDYAEWIDSAIIYGITPYIFVNSGQFSHITQKIPEIADLGVNTLWIQPVYETYERGQGYGIINYFKVRSDLGSEEDLRTLVQTAHDHELKVLFDFVPNHSSIQHPFARESVQLGEKSHYYDFYQREFDSVPYSQHYHQHPEGFIRYFWEHLPNLNYHNAEVQRWITEAGRYWIEEFDIDGYRIDAVWGVNARNPEFMQEWRRALKRIKPEVMLLGEDKASWHETFESRFDVAYDWTTSESWVSQWVWQTFFSEDSNPTIFNNDDPNIRAGLLRNSLTNNGNGYHPDAKILRFLENNDTYRFLESHGLERTKMAAALTFSLHGIPLIFNGQEIGETRHPYQTASIYNLSESIESQSRPGLYDFYKQLIRIRTDYPAFNTDNFEEIPVEPSGAIYSFRRWHENQNILVVINLGEVTASAKLDLPVEEFNLESEQIYFLSDLIDGEYFEVHFEDLHEFKLNINAFTTRIFVLDDEIISDNDDDSGETGFSDYFELYQNYPNPFHRSTTIRYLIPEADHVYLAVYDLLGRRVDTLINEYQSAGDYQTVFHMPGLASGVYFYKLITEYNSKTRKMLLVR